MNKIHYLQKYLLFLLVTILTCLLFSGSLVAQEVLIFSTTHNNEGVSKVKKAKGELIVHVSSFSKIKELLLNGRRLPLQNETKATIKQRYYLKRGQNHFRLVVKTDDGIISKNFILEFNKSKREKSKSESPFKLITLFGLQSLDNVTNAANGTASSSGLKASLTLIPRYKLPFSKKSGLVFQSIILREQFSDATFSANEIIFNQLTIDWENKSSIGNYKVGLGFNDIQNDAAGIIAGENKLESDSFLAVKYNPNVLKDLALGFKYTQKSLDIPDNIDYDNNGTLISFSAGLKTGFSILKLGLNAGVDNNDSFGKYQQFVATNLKLNLSLLFGKTFTLSVTDNTRKLTYSEKDPLKGNLAEVATNNTLSVKGNYIISLKSGLMSFIEYKQNSQTSNVTDRNYQANTISLTMMYIY